MSQKKPALIGRIAVQLKLVNPEELAQATAAQARSPDKRLGEVMVELGLIDARQLQKLETVQRDLIARHRAQQGGGAPSPGPAAKPSAAAPAPGSADASIHGAAARAAEEAAPVDQESARALAQTPAPKPPSGPVADAAPPPRAAPPPSPRPAAPPPAPEGETASAQPTAPDAADPGALDWVLPDADPGALDQLHGILRDAVSAGASDVHLHSGGVLKLRIHGELVARGDAPLGAGAVERVVASALSPDQRAQLGRDGEIDFCLDVPGAGRFRANAYRQQRGFDLVMRSIPASPPTLEELGLPAELARLTEFHQGMVLLTGPAGCGKSATLAAMVNLINEQRDEHVLTVEDPIEVVHPPKRCLVNQRHAGHHTNSFARALRGALREDPDIIVIGELRDLETISLAMTAAETGHFVLATLHTNNAVRTINRMIGAFPSNEQAQVRAMLSESLRAVVSQRLVPKADGSGRIPALEVLVINKAIGNLIRDEKTVQIRSSMQTGRAHGMYLLEQSLNELVASGRITRETGLRYAEEKKLITAGA
jgi:twitching motility protein PilT